MRRFTVYQLSSNDRWHWQIVSPNGRTIGSSAVPGFSTKSAAQINANAVRVELNDAKDREELI